MKKIIKISLTVIALATQIYSCSNQNEDLQEINSVFKVSKVTNEKTINEITNSLNKNTDYKKGNSDYDFSTISEIYNTETNDLSYMVNSSKNVNLKLGIYPKSNGDYTVLQVEESINDNFKTVIYKNLNNTILAELLFNLDDGSMTVIKSKSSNTQSKCDGSDVMECVDINYNDNGWWGVAGYVITIFQPWFGVAVLAGCAAYVCI